MFVIGLVPRLLGTKSSGESVPRHPTCRPARTPTYLLNFFPSASHVLCLTRSAFCAAALFGARILRPPVTTPKSIHQLMDGLQVVRYSQYFRMHDEYSQVSCPNK